MNLQIASDLHLDQLKNKDYKKFIYPVADVLILAGYICHIENLYSYSDFFSFAF